MLATLLQATPLPDPTVIIQSGNSAGGIDWWKVLGAGLGIFVSAFGGTFVGHVLNLHRDHRDAVKQWRITALESVAALLDNPGNKFQTWFYLHADYDNLRKLAKRTADPEVIRLVDEMERLAIDYDDVSILPDPDRVNENASKEHFRETKQALEDHVERRLNDHFR